MSAAPLTGRVALITGAGRGIGRATALRLASDGAAVVVNDIDESSGRQAVQDIERASGRAAFVYTDVSDESDVQTMIAFAEETFGRLDILVNNAAPPVDPPFFPQADTDRCRRTLVVCLVGAMLTIQHALYAMAKRGGAPSSTSPRWPASASTHTMLPNTPRRKQALCA